MTMYKEAQMSPIEDDIFYHNLDGLILFGDCLEESCLREYFNEIADDQKFRVN